MKGKGKWGGIKPGRSGIERREREVVVVVVREKKKTTRSKEIRGEREKGRKVAVAGEGA